MTTAPTKPPWRDVDPSTVPNSVGSYGVNMSIDDMIEGRMMLHTTEGAWMVLHPQQYMDLWWSVADFY